MRRPLARGLTTAHLLAAALLGCAGVVVGCDAPPELQPDRVLQDSLGLGPRDRAHAVSLTFHDGSEAATPDSFEVREGDWVDFRADDARPRTVEFVMDSLPTGGDGFLEGQGTTSSPPLLGPGVHWAVPFLGAPAGRYPFRVTGGGRSKGGVLVVVPRR